MHPLSVFLFATRWSSPHGIHIMSTETGLKEGNFMGFEVGVGIPLFYGATKARIKAAKKDKEIAEYEIKQEQLDKQQNIMHA